MGKTTVLTDNWSLGRISDINPTRLPANSLIRCINMIPDFGLAPLVMRNPWEYSFLGGDYSDFSASTTEASGLAWAPFHGGEGLVIVDQDGRILLTDIGGTGHLLDATGLGDKITTPPFWHQDRLVILGADGATFPWAVTFDGSSYVTTPFSDPFPKARFGASWGEFVLLGNGGDPDDSYTVNLRRLWFLDAGTFTYTSANNSFFDFPDEIIFAVPFTNSIIVVGYRKLWNLTGTTPPADGVSTDMSIEELYPQGAIDPKSIALWNGYMIFANAEGIWKTDGTSLVSITTAAELNTAWRGDMGNFTLGWSLAAGVWQNYYIATAVDDSGVEQFTYVINLELQSSKGNEAGFNFKGFPTRMYAPVQGAGQTSVINATQDLLFTVSGVPNTGRMQPVFDPGGDGTADPTGDNIAIDVITSFYMLGSLGEKRLRRAFFTYAWDTPVGGNLSVSYSKTPNPFLGPIDFVDVDSFPAQASGRQPVFVNDRTRWISFRITNLGAEDVVNPVKGLALYSIDVEGHIVEQSRSGV